MWWRKKKDLGCWGEEVAKRYLQGKGYKILAEHWTSRIGELDLVAKKNGRYIIVEVKTRTSRAFGTPEEAIDIWKQRKLAKTGELFLLKHHLVDVPWQIDAVAVEIMEGGRTEIRHLENVVQRYNA